MSFSKISLDDIQKASQCLHGVVLRTPILFSRSISELLDTEVYLKLENKQVTGSFKARGAYNKISSLSFLEST